MHRATIDLEPKIRTADENLILLPNMKQLFLFAGLTSDHIFAHFYLLNHFLRLQKSLILDFLLGIITENVYSLAYFLNKLNAEPLTQNKLS